MICGAFSCTTSSSISLHCCYPNRSPLPAKTLLASPPLPPPPPKQEEAYAFEPLTARFELTASSPLTTGVKCACVEALILVTHYRTHFRLGRLLQAFKEMTEDRRWLRELRGFSKVRPLCIWECDSSAGQQE